MGVGFVVFVLLVVTSFESRRSGTSIPVDELFETLIGRPVPADVIELQGAGTTWQGYSIYLRFRAPSLEAAGFASPPYEPADCSRVIRILPLPESIDSPFAPAWSPSLGPDATCLEAHELVNEWTGSATHRVLQAGGWVHFVGIGS